ncbi:ornithine cyclodeaminase family protein [Brevibacillus agri]|uniref:ornithine cyclodeaminase family protein n=1 Tax=Brevibacillus agri TaxID=51101 RepID=UPI00068864CA|nr:ornithine cyclodeaminase family protein [Brevibacillus agri]MED4571572.1 ornithine cyclodeaminase family protein [Brevibacillus agri]WHX31776.1 ornithine cyclodeaminase family protein [Brevibacillus agri]
MSEQAVAQQAVDKAVRFLYLSQEDCIKAGGLDMRGTLEIIEKSFTLHGRKDIVQPMKPVIRWGGPETEETRGRIMTMPSYLGGDLDVAGVKWIPSMPQNPQKYGQPRASAVIILADPNNGFPLAVMDGTIVSAMRTGAATGVAAKYLARPDSSVVGVIGAGVQSRTQIMAINGVFQNQLKQVKVYDLNEEKTKKFADEMSRELNLDVVPVESAEAAIRDSDIVVTATMSTFPYVKGEWLKEGAFHSEISFWDTAPEELVNYNKIVVDDFEQVSHHGVDVSYRAVRDGFISEGDIHELGKIIIGEQAGRSHEQEKILFNPIGMSIHDVSEAYRVYQNAVKLGIGQKLSLWEQAYWT